MNSKPNGSLDPPYIGIRPFEESDAERFFGRDEWREIIIDNFMSCRLTLLYGESGVGKSSVLGAGVVSKLKQMAAQNKHDFGMPKLAVVMFNSWSNAPLNGLFECIQEAAIEALQLSPEKAEKIKQLMPRFSTLTETLQAWSRCVGGRLYVVLDQFEDYFLYQPEVDDRYQFIWELSQAVKNPDLRAKFLISIQEESYAKLDRLQVEIPNLFNRSLRLKHLNQKEAEDAIVKPVEQYYNNKYEQKYQIEPGLPEKILQDVEVTKAEQLLNFDSGHSKKHIQNKQQESILAIETFCLQLVMERLWEEEQECNSEILRIATYNRLGRAENIIKKYVNDQMEKLSPQMQEIAAGIFRYLVTKSRTKIAYSIDDLASLVIEESNRKLTEKQEEYVKSLVKNLVEKLREVRIICSIKALSGQKDHYEISHSLLVPAILDWRRDYLEKVRRRTMVRGIVGLILLILSIILLFIGESYKRELQELSDNALIGNSQLDKLIAAMKIRRKIDNNNPSLYWLELTDRNFVNKLDEKSSSVLPESLENLREQNKFQREQMAVWKKNFDIDDPLSTLTYVTTSEDGTIRLWNLQDKEPISEFNKGKGEVLSIWLSPQNEFLATTSKDGTVRLWDLQSKESKPMELPSDASRNDKISISFSHDGNKLATGSKDGTVRLWDLQSEESKPMELPSDTSRNDKISSISFSHDGNKLATGSEDGTVRLWDLQSKESKLIDSSSNTSRNDKNSVFSISSIGFSHDGNKLATGSEDGTVRLWDLQGDQIKLLGESKKHTEKVSDVSFRKDGSRLTTASADNTARLWKSEKKLEELTEFKGHNDDVSTVKFDRDDANLLITTSIDGTVRFWNLKKPAMLPEPQRKKPDELLDIGCSWLEDYRNTHPEEEKDLPCSQQSENRGLNP